MEGLQTAQVGVENKYGYNGKEMNDVPIAIGIGLDWIDYGARWYDPSIAMFQTIDPKTEQFTFQSPYVYAANNPILYIDENGENPIRAALSIFKAVKKVRKARKRGKKLNFKDLLSDEIQSIIEDGSTILDPNASLLEKAAAAVDLVSGLDVSDYSNKRVKKQSRFLEKTIRLAAKDNYLSTVKIEGKKITKAVKKVKDPFNNIKWKRTMNSKQVIKMLKKAGFKKVSQKGSHTKYELGGKSAIIPNHGKKDIPIGTLKSIKKQVTDAVNSYQKGA